MNKKIINYNEKLYVLIRDISKEYIDSRIKGTREEVLKLWQEALMCDKILQNNTHYLFVNNIDDVEFTEEKF
jgi:hypothetical protein